MAKVEYDTHKTPSITLSLIDQEEIKETGYVQVDVNLFVMETDEDNPRLIVLKTVPYNKIGFENKHFILEEK